mgnify:CR=1 FL=1
MNGPFWSQPEGNGVKTAPLSVALLGKAGALPSSRALRSDPVELAAALVLALVAPAQAFAWGGEPIVLDGATVGEISSVGWSPLAGACVALGYVRGAGANMAHDGTPAHIELWGERVPVRLHDQWPPRG